MGKIPALEGDSVKLTETIAISTVSTICSSWYLVKASGESINLILLVLGQTLRLIQIDGKRFPGAGSGGPLVDELGKRRTPCNAGKMVPNQTPYSPSFFAAQVLPISDLFHRFLPLIPNFASPAPYDHQAVERGKAASLAILETLETILEERTYLVGDGITLADVFVAIMFSRGLEWVLDAELRARCPSCMRHFNMIASWEPVKWVVPTFKLVDVEPLNRNPYK